MNSVFQQLFMQPTVRALILRSRPVPDDEEATSVFAQMQIMFANLADGCSDYAFTPSGFWNALTDYDGQPINVHEHQVRRFCVA
jgi:ubiquitin carboxyl-terminal hydrolase 9/24